jgi:hypothetical protein
MLCRSPQPTPASLAAVAPTTLSLAGGAWNRGRARSSLNPLRCRRRGPSPHQPRRGTAYDLYSSLDRSIHIITEASEIEPVHASPKLEYPLPSDGWREFCAKCEKVRAPRPRDMQNRSFVKSRPANRLVACLAQICELRSAKKRKNTCFQTPTPQSPLPSRINNIRGNRGLAPKLLCPLASADRGLGQKLKIRIYQAVNSSGNVL